MYSFCGGFTSILCWTIVGLCKTNKGFNEFKFRVEFSFHSIFAQNGFNIRLNEINNCAGPDQVITIDSNSTIKLTEDCQLIIVGCTTTTGFAKADVGKQLFESILSAFNGISNFR